MNRKSKELKRLARETLNMKYHIPMTAFFLSGLIAFLIEAPFSSSLAKSPSLNQYIIFYAADFFISLILSVLNAGQSYIHLNMSRQKEYSVKQLFFAFRRQPERYVGAEFLTMVFSFVSSVPLLCGAAFTRSMDVGAASVTLLIGTGVVSLVLNLYFLLTYGLVTYLLIDRAELKVTTAFRECRLMMRHQKGRFLYLALSFLGWYLLILASFGVASLWIIPYQNQTQVKFYQDLTGELDCGQVNFSDSAV